MQIAILSDIHGNLEALQAVVADITDRPVDRIVCLGDMIGYGPDPEAVVCLIREMGCLSEEKNIAQAETTVPEKGAKLSILTPSVDIYENSEEYLLYADLPGVNKEDITIDLDNGQLTLVGNRLPGKTKGQLMEEFGPAQYRRVFSVPQGLDLSRVDAELNDGVLKLHLPKSEAVKPRKIEIREG